MTTRGRKLWRRAALGLLAVAALGLVAPYLSADHFGGRIRLELEQSLHRRVEMRAARFNLFQGPGFSLLDVVIHDDPTAGLEPFAHVGSIEARVSLTGLLRGKLEFSKLTLDEPSVNLVKTEAGHWNFQPLLNPAAAARIPRLSVRDGRLNFKAGGVKSVFYFSNADVDITPPGAPGEAFELGFRGDPTRSDRTARGFGTLRGRGRWRPSPEPGGEVEFDLNLERTSLGEVATLMYGRDLGVHGQVSGRARFRGALSALQINGTLDLDDIHRWDLLPPYAKGGPLDFRGALDLLGQNLEVETVPTSRTAATVRFRVSDYLVRPRWAAGLSVNGLPVPPLADVARHMGLEIGREVRLDGEISGAVSYSPEEGMRGSFLLNGASVSALDSPVVRIEEARLVLEGNHVRMPPAAVAIGEREHATLLFDYLLEGPQLDLKLTTAGMSIAALQSGGGPLPGVPKPGFVSGLRGGEWEGSLAYRRQGQAPGAWTGDIRLKETQFDLAGLAAPVELRSAVFTVRGDRLHAEHVTAAAGGIEIEGSYDYRPGLPRPHRLVMRTEQLRAADLEGLLAPTLRPRRGFLSRTLRLGGAGVPEWLRQRRVLGSLQAGTLEIGGATLEAVRLDFFWDGAVIDVPRFVARASGGTAEGNLQVDLRGPEPAIQVAGRLEAAAWRGGRLSGDATISTRGFEEALRRNLRAEGTFRMQGVALTEDAPPVLITGAWTADWERRRPRVAISSLRWADTAGVLTGHGGTNDEDRLFIVLSGAERSLRLTGSLSPLVIAEAESRASP